jgi:hypothetical protein
MLAGDVLGLKAIVCDARPDSFCAQNTRLFGYAGPSTAKSTEAFTKYIITDMYAKGVQGMKAEDAVKWAAGELGKIYG